MLYGMDVKVKKDIKVTYIIGSGIDNISPARVYNRGSIADDGSEYAALTELFNVTDMSSVIASYNEAKASAF